MSLSALLVVGAIAKSISAQTLSFTTPAASPTDTSSFYVGASNGSLSHTPKVHGRAFDRIIHIWLENTDYSQAAPLDTFKYLSTQGITLTGYYALTHTSEPNYIAAAGGGFWGLYNDNLEYIPTNMSTIVDLLDEKGISWAEYQENMPSDGYPGFSFTNPDGYTYYVRKHNPLIIYNSVAMNATRAARIRNFNDFAYDLGNNSLPQWIFVTPNMKDDGHDTGVAYAAEWLEYWLVPLLKDHKFNSEKTLIVLTFDENKTYAINNNVYAVLLGGAVPNELRGTFDDTFYTHYSGISTVEANWDLGNLGRGDTNKTLANVFNFVAEATGYQNNGLTNSSHLPLLNLTGHYPGPLNPQYYVPYLAPNTSATGGGHGPTYVAPGTNMSLNAWDAPAPVNLTAT